MNEWKGFLKYLQLSIPLCLFLLSLSVSGEELTKVSALGRIEPKDGVFQVAGPPDLAVVIKELLVSEGDQVKKGKVIAILAGVRVAEAEVARLKAELENTKHELNRNEPLFKRRTITDSEWKSLQLARDVAVANLQRAKAKLELLKVRAPISGQVLEVHTKAGERVENKGIVELGDTSAMYVVAEVYETDIGRVRVGQKARIHSPALPHDVTGTVEHIGLKIGKKDILDTDPVADADARVVEVDINLDEPSLVSSLTNLRVEVLIEP